MNLKLRDKLVLGHPRVIVGIIFLGFLFAFSNFTVVAQVNSENWQPPIDLAAEVDYTTLGMAPQVATDLEGRVHVIWGVWIGPDPNPNAQPNTLIYTVWDGSGWAIPVDILAAPNFDQGIVLHSLSTTRGGEVVVVWSVNNTLFISLAKIREASNPRGWSTTSEMWPDQVTSAKLIINQENDVWCLVYTEATGYVRVLVSEDNGITWLPIQDVWSTNPGTASPDQINATFANNGDIEIVWSEATAERNWNAVAIWHAQIEADHWSDSIVREVARSNISEPTLGWPVIVTGKGETLHLFWNNGVGSSTGRFHQWSMDNGNTWSDIEQVFPNDLSGQTGYAGIAVDSNSALHVITSANSRNDSRESALRYTVWQDGKWTPYITLWHETGLRGEQPVLALTGGNRLHLVWRDVQVGMIAYSTSTVDAPHVDPIRFEMMEISEDHTSVEENNTDVDYPETSTPTPVLESHNIPVATSTMDNRGVWYGITPPLLVVVAVILIFVNRKKQRN